MAEHAVHRVLFALDRVQTHLQSKMWSIAKEWLPEAKREEFFRYARLADDIQTPRELAAIEVAVGVQSHLPSQLDTLESMLQSALRGVGICCEAAADKLVAGCLRSFPKYLLDLPDFQEEWLTIAGSAAFDDMRRAKENL